MPKSYFLASLFSAALIIGAAVAAEAPNASATSIQCRVPPNTKEYTLTTTTYPTYNQVILSDPTLPSVTCVNNPPAGGWTLSDVEVLINTTSPQNPSVSRDRSVACLWERPTNRPLAYDIAHHGGGLVNDAVDCSTAAYPAGTVVKARACAVPTNDGRCLSDICLLEQLSDVPHAVTLGHHGASAARREHVDCRQTFGNVERVCLLSENANCLSDLCLVESAQQCEQPPAPPKPEPKPDKPKCSAWWCAPTPVSKPVSSTPPVSKPSRSPQASWSSRNSWATPSWTLPSSWVNSWKSGW